MVESELLAVCLLLSMITILLIVAVSNFEPDGSVSFLLTPHHPPMVCLPVSMADLGNKTCYLLMIIGFVLVAVIDVVSDV